MTEQVTLTNLQISLTIELGELEKLRDGTAAKIKRCKDAITEEMFKDAKIGTTNFELHNGWKMKAVVGETMTLDKDNDKIRAMQDNLEDHIAKKIVTWKPTLSKKAYDMLSPEDKVAVDKVLTTKPKPTTIALVEPKKEA